MTTDESALAANTGIDAGAVDIRLDPVQGDDLVAGTPAAGTFELGQISGTEVGLWELSEGTVRDTESDEIFVVLSGAGTVRFMETGETIELGPGVLVRLAEGSRTEWTITQRLRKVYIA